MSREETEAAKRADDEARAKARIFKHPQPRSGARIVSFVDPVRKVVWFKINKVRAKGSQKPIAGYKTITEGDVTEVHRARAGALASNKALLLSKLAEHVFVEACRLRGIEPTDLLPRPRSDFEHEPNRVQKLDPAEAELRFNHFERGRHHRIALACSQEDHCILQIKQHLHDKRMYNATLSAGFKTNLEREQAHLGRMQRARAKYEAVLEDENCKILENQSEAMSKLAARKNRYKRIDEMKKALQEVRRRRGREKQERIREHLERNERQFEEQREALMEARRLKEERVQKHLDAMGKDYSARREHEAKVRRKSTAENQLH